LVEQGGVDPILRGLFAGPAKVKIFSWISQFLLIDFFLPPCKLDVL
jgi:hypothetical protein